MRLTKRPNSPNWFLEIRLNGKKYVRSTKSSHKPTAKKIATELFRAIQIESVREPSNEITFEDAIARYLSVRKGSANERMLHSIHRTVLRFIDCKTLLSDITGKHLSDFVDRRKAEGRKPQTIKHGVSFICAVMKKAKKEGYIVASVEAPVILIKATRLRYLTTEEENRLLEELHPLREGKGIPHRRDRPEHILKELQDNFDLVIMLLDTGARYGEVARLKWKHIDLKSGTIKLWRPKVSNESIIYITSRVERILKRRFHTSHGEYLFTNRSGGHRGATCHGIRRAFKRAGLHDCTIHTLRHTNATRLVRNGLSIYEVRSVLGHTDIKTTMRYAHLENVEVTKKARNVIQSLNDE